MSALGYSLSDTSPPATVGNTAAQAVINFRHADGSNQTRNDNGTPANPDDDTVSYPDPACTPTPTPSCYQPTRQWNQPTDPWRWKPLCVRTAAGVAAGVPPEPADGNCTPSPTQTYYTTQRPLTPQWPGHYICRLAVAVQVTGPPKKPEAPVVTMRRRYGS